MGYLIFYYAFGCILFVMLTVVFVVSQSVPFWRVYVYSCGVCGTFLCVQYSDIPIDSNNHRGVEGRMGLHSLSGVVHPLQVVAVVDVVVLQVYWVLQAVGVLLVLVGVTALVQDVPLY
jgi:hypothetical protein